MARTPQSRAVSKLEFAILSVAKNPVGGVSLRDKRIRQRTDSSPVAQNDRLDPFFFLYMSDFDTALPPRAGLCQSPGPSSRILSSSETAKEDHLNGPTQVYQQRWQYHSVGRVGGSA